MKQSEEALIRACGGYCGSCLDYLAYIRNDEELKKHLAERFSKQFDMHIEPEDVGCLGCHGTIHRPWCASCSIQRCTEGKGILTCAFCDQFPCEELEKHYGERSENRVHLLRQREIGLEKWLEEVKMQQDWKTVLKADPTDQLLQHVGNLDRYYILRELMEKPEDDAEVSSIRNALVDEILSKQMEDGSWNGKAYDYEDGTTHQLMKLVELGMNTQDEPVKKGVDYLFRCQQEDGTFEKKEGGCGVDAGLVATNAALLALARTGYGDDPRVAKGYEWLCDWQQEDGSWLSPRAKISREQGEGHPHPHCGLHATCNALLGLSATERTRQSQPAKWGAEFILSIYGSKYDRSNEPPYAVTSTPFDGAWHDPNCVNPAITDRSEKVVEINTTEHVLSTLSMLGYGLENEKVRAGVQRLIGFQSQDGLWLRHHQLTLGTLMTIKSFYQPLCVFSYHGH